MTDTQTPEDQAADLDNVERDANHWWSWKLLFPIINMVFSLYSTYVEMEQFYLALNIFPIERAPTQLTLTFTLSCSGRYSGN